MAESELEQLARTPSATEKATRAKNAAARADQERRTATTRAITEGLDVENVEHEGGDVTADARLHPSYVEPTNDTNLAEQIATIRRKRMAWGSGLQQKLALPKRRGYHRHWFNDFGNRIEDAKASGWAHINGSDGRPIQRVVGSARSGQPLTAFAMELPEAIWLEDLEAKNKLAEEQLEQVRTQPFKVGPGMSQKSDQGKFYNPHEEQGKGPVEISRKG